MKQLTNNILIGLGVIFVVFILISLWFVIADPYNLKSMIFGTPYIPTQNTKTGTSSSDGTAINGSFQLSNAQKQALISFGIDPASVPSSINTAQEACFVSVLGEVRVSQIKDGAVPSGIEFLKAKACI